jgi:hypothetical protein
VRFKGLEHYRGLLPIGLHYDADSKWLLVACAGINAIAVIDVEKRAGAGTHSHRLVSHACRREDRHSMGDLRQGIRHGTDGVPQ